MPGEFARSGGWRQLTVERAGEWVVIEATANAFLHHMMRNIAGLLIAIGPGRCAAILGRGSPGGRDRSAGAATAPAEGLYFWDVRYPAVLRLPAPPGDAGRPDPLSSRD